MRPVASYDADRQVYNADGGVRGCYRIVRIARQTTEPGELSLYWPHSPKSTVAPAGIQAFLIPAFIYHTSVSLPSLSTS